MYVESNSSEHAMKNTGMKIRGGRGKWDAKEQWVCASDKRMRKGHDDARTNIET